jgi:hypothetical protein
MPLVKGKAASTRKGFSENVKREMDEGKKQSQSVAIAYSEARKGKEKPMKKQTKMDKEHEHLGTKHGAESKHKQSMKDRVDEAKAMKKKDHKKK